MNMGLLGRTAHQQSDTLSITVHHTHLQKYLSAPVIASVQRVKGTQDIGEATLGKM